MAHHLLLHSRSSSFFKSQLVSSPPPSLCQAIKRYSQNKGNDDHVIGEKARSTAEEFSRVAKEKAESVTETAKNTWEGAKEAVTGGGKESKKDSDKHRDKESHNNLGGHK